MNAGGERQRQDPMCKGSKILNVIFVFSKDLCANSLVEQLSSGSIQNVLVCGMVFVQYF
jgi:hypothetical protein